MDDYKTSKYSMRRKPKREQNIRISHTLHSIGI